MKNLISVITIALILILCAVINADAQTIKPVKIPYSFKAPKNSNLPGVDQYTYTFLANKTVVSAGGSVVVLNHTDIAYVASKLSDKFEVTGSIIKLLKSYPISIKNNEAADLIIAIWRAKK